MQRLDINIIRERIQLVSNCVCLETKYINNSIKMKFKCECGNIFETSYSNFISGKQRCKICSQKETKGERKVRQYLEKNNIKFIQEKRFDKCVNERTLSFDFYLKELNIIIEYDGEGHYFPVKFAGISQDKANYKFNKGQINDKIKNKFCKDSNIKLLRIKYDSYNEIEMIIKEFIKQNNKEIINIYQKDSKVVKIKKINK